jgi:hypothetical protein
MSDSPSSNQLNPTSFLLYHSNNRTGYKPGLLGALNNKSFRYSLLLGAIAGLIFSLTLWGYEAILFIQAHLAFPWLPMLAGTILCVLVCTLAAFLEFFSQVNVLIDCKGEWVECSTISAQPVFCKSILNP